MHIPPSAFRLRQKLLLARGNLVSEGLIDLISKVNELFDGKGFDLHGVPPRVESSRKVENE
jgi:hypothetical protein